MFEELDYKTEKKIKEIIYCHWFYYIYIYYDYDI